MPKSVNNPELSADERIQVREMLRASAGTKFIIQSIRVFMIWIAAVGSGVVAIKYLWTNFR
jgi:hypothetical protein